MAYENKRMTREEYAEMKEIEREQAYTIITDTVEKIAAGGDEMRQFLNTSARLDRYSPSNVLLIHGQIPQATQMKTFADWAKDNIRVAKGAKSISILEPVEYTRNDGSTGVSFNVKKVFDISQTNRRHRTTQNSRTNEGILVDSMLQISPVPYAVTEDPVVDENYAVYDKEEQVIKITPMFNHTPYALYNLAKEVSMAQLDMDGSVQDIDTQRYIADCVGYMLCKKHGFNISTANFDCVPPEGFADRDTKEVKKDFDKMRNTFKDLNDRLNDEITIQKDEIKKEFER